MNRSIESLSSQTATLIRGLMGLPTPVAMPSQPFHAEALDWAQRVRRNGGDLSDDTLSAVSRFCAQIDAAGIRSAMLRLNLMCGSNLAACLVPLYRSTVPLSLVGGATDTNNNFVSADYIERGPSGGLTGSAATVKFLNTNATLQSLRSGNSVHMSISADNVSGTVERIIIGTFNNTSPGLACIDENNSTTYGNNGGRSVRLGTFATGLFPFSKQFQANEPHLIGTRQSATACALLRNGQTLARSASSVTCLFHDRPVFVFTLNANNSTVSATSPARVRTYSFGNGLDGTQSRLFSDAVVAFNLAMGR